MKNDLKFMDNNDSMVVDISINPLIDHVVYIPNKNSWINDFLYRFEWLAINNIIRGML